MGTKPTPPAQDQSQNTNPVETPEPSANVDPGTDDAGDVSDQAQHPSEDTPPEWDEERFNRHNAIFGFGEQEPAVGTPKAAEPANAADAGKPPGEPAKAETPADPFAEIEKGLEAADLASALGYDPVVDKDDPQFQAVEKFVSKQNTQTKALVGIIRQQHQAVQALQGVAQNFQKQQDLAMVMQAHAAADYVAKAHPFFAKQMGLYATGKATKEQLAVRNEVVKRAASLIAEGKADNLASAIEAVAYGKWAKFKAKVDNAQAKTPPPGGVTGAKREPKTMREAVLGR